MSSLAITVTRESFTQLIAKLTERLRGRGLDQSLEDDLNAFFPAGEFTRSGGA
jgi:hypothetical protein